MGAVYAAATNSVRRNRARSVRDMADGGGKERREEKRERVNNDRNFLFLCSCRHVVGPREINRDCVTETERE
jgi:hypothetical protein